MRIPITGAEKRELLQCISRGYIETTKLTRIVREIRQTPDTSTEQQKIVIEVIDRREQVRDCTDSPDNDFY